MFPVIMASFDFEFTEHFPLHVMSFSPQSSPMKYLGLYTNFTNKEIKVVIAESRTQTHKEWTLSYCG